MSVRDQLDGLGRRAALPGAVANAGLGVVLAVLLAYEAHLISRQHGNWLFDLAAGTLVCAAALLRGRSAAAAATAGLAVCGAAELAAWLWQLPAQPDAAADLALLVLDRLGGPGAAGPVGGGASRRPGRSWSRGPSSGTWCSSPPGSRFPSPRPG